MSGLVTISPAPSRAGQLRRALRLEVLTVGWNVVEGGVGMAAALAAGSTALLGFALDSFVESASGTVLLWRLHAERRATDPAHVERLETRARRLVAISLFVLAAWITGDALRALGSAAKPETSWVGMALTLVSMFAMVFLARAKRRAAVALGSRALEADAFQTTACFWLSVVTLVGLALNALAGWWWADPVAALGVALLVAKEGREAWRGERCGCEGECAP
jgi:divalent metal cation (Fe/Co/Zn/Cd) transporter